MNHINLIRSLGSSHRRSSREGADALGPAGTGVRLDVDRDFRVATSADAVHATPVQARGKGLRLPGHGS